MDVRAQGRHTRPASQQARRRRVFTPVFTPAVPHPLPGLSTVRTSMPVAREGLTAYRRRLANRQRVFLGGTVQAVSPLLGGTGTLSATVVDTAKAVVAFTGVGSMDVFSFVAEVGTFLDYRPADTTLVVTGHDLREQAECQMGCGADVPAGTTDFGFTDTTYSVTKAQILATCSSSVL